MFGGANVLKGFTANPVGTRNSQFVRNYLAAEHIPIVAEDLLGIHPRKVWFFPQTGKVIVQKLPHAHEAEAEVAAVESAVRARLSRTPVSGGVPVKGSQTTTTTYAAADQPYAAIAAQQDGEDRAAADLARLIRLDIMRVLSGPR